MLYIIAVLLLLDQCLCNYYIKIKSQKDLVKSLQNGRFIKSDQVANVMTKVDLKYFSVSLPYYEDEPSPLGYNSFSSPPHVYAMTLEYLKDHLREGNRVLDVGSGNAYLTVCMSEMVGNTGFVVGIEHMKGLVEFANLSIKAYNKRLSKSDRIRIDLGDGREGVPQDAPYDAINVGAGCSKVPKALLDQLENGGRMLVPLIYPDRCCYLTIVDKDLDGNILKTKMEQYSFMPLIDKKAQWK